MPQMCISFINTKILSNCYVPKLSPNLKPVTDYIGLIGLILFGKEMNTKTHTFCWTMSNRIKILHKMSADWFVKKKEQVRQMGKHPVPGSIAKKKTL